MRLCIVLDCWPLRVSDVIRTRHAAFSPRLTMAAGSPSRCKLVLDP